MKQNFSESPPGSNPIQQGWTRERRVLVWYRTLAGEFPGPNRSAIAAILAHHLVELEDREGQP